MTRANEGRGGDSPALTFVRHLWDHAFGATRKSWRTYNASLNDALRLAVRSGMVFGVDDFSVMSDVMNVHYWWGQTEERFYTLAVESKNLTACRAWEKYKDRRPFTAAGKRLAVGSELKWNGLPYRLTSFSVDGKEATFCLYSRDELGRRKVKSRLVLTPSEIRASRKRPAPPRPDPGVTHFMRAHRNLFRDEVSRRDWRRSRTLREAWYWCQDFRLLRDILMVLNYQGSFYKVETCRSAPDLKAAVSWDELAPLFEPYTRRRRRKEKTEASRDGE